MRPLLAKRRGAISLTALLAVPVLLLIVGLVVYVALLRASRGEAQGGADAAALAAAHALATDDLIRAGDEHNGPRLEQARAAARAVAGANASAGARLALDGESGGEITFGTQDRPLSEFRPLAGGDRANAVRIVAGRPPLRAPFGGGSTDAQVRARATALLDRQVVGFRPVGDGTAPVVPLGLRFAREGVPVSEWEPAWRGGRDDWRFDPASGQFVAGSDGIPEFEVVIGAADPSGAAAAGAFLRFGATDPDGALRQFRSGVNAVDLSNSDGELSLAAHNTNMVPGSAECPPPGHPLRAAIEQALREDRGPRAWPLFAAGDPDAGTVRLCGWTGARVVSVDGSGAGLRLRLQPAVLCHPAALTGPSPDPVPAFWAGNRTVFALRLAE